MVDYKKIKYLTDKKFDKLFKKASKVSSVVDKLEVSSSSLTSSLTLEDEWSKYCKELGVCADWYVYPYREERDIVKIYNSHKNHSSIQIPIEAKKIVDYIKVNSRTDKEIVMKVCGWVSDYIEYDDVHASSSRLYKEGKNLIYLNATETFNTRVGICGEVSLLNIGMLSYAGIPSTIYRPWISHIAVIAKTRLNQHFMCDAIYGKFEEVQPITEKTSKESYYEIGVSNINENYRYNWEKRRDKGLEFGIVEYGRELTVEELLDVERALLCKPLKYGTLVGLLEQEKMLSVCKKLEKEKEREKVRVLGNYKLTKKDLDEDLEDLEDLGDLDEWNKWNQWKGVRKI